MMNQASGLSRHGCHAALAADHYIYVPANTACQFAAVDAGTRLCFLQKKISLFPAGAFTIKH
jgi:hypothetical protein